MDIVDTYTDVTGEVNEKLAARKFAIEYLQERGHKFYASPTSIQLCNLLGMYARSKQHASNALLKWASNRMHA